MSYLMNINTPLQPVLATENSLLKQTLLITAGVIVLAIASQICIPLIPVPLTFQSATVVLIGMALGARNGAYVIATYLLAGALGLPVFAQFHAGLPVFFGPDSGYLLGFLPAAFISGYLAEKGLAKNRLGSFLAAIIGVSIIFLFGVSVLANMIGWQQAIELGLMPFIFSETCKLIAVALVIPRLWKQR